MRVVRDLVAVSAVAVSMLSTIGFAAAQAPAKTLRQPNQRQLTLPATTTPAAPTQDGSPVPASPFPQGPPTKPGLELIEIHTADRKWREAQRGYVDPRRANRVQPKELRSVDPATQAKEYEHLKSVAAQLDKLNAADMSESERINLEIYRYQIATQMDGQKFKEWEKPVNSLETFWTGVQGTGQRGFRKEEDYSNFLLWMADIPRFYDENIANMRAGLARGFTPPKITLAGRDQMIAPIANAKSADETPFWKAFINMPSTINTAEQARLRAEGKKVIEGTVIPEYQKLLAFWNNEYYPKTVNVDRRERPARWQGILQRPDQAVHDARYDGRGSSRVWFGRGRQDPPGDVGYDGGGEVPRRFSGVPEVSADRSAVLPQDQRRAAGSGLVHDEGV